MPCSGYQQSLRPFQARSVSPIENRVARLFLQGVRIMDRFHQSDGPRESVPLRLVEVELLALDLNSCTRCAGTLTNIDQALALVGPVLEATGARVNVSRVVVKSEEQARRYQLVSSPTIRVNGRDIAAELLESACQSCTDLCGCGQGTTCRVWRYQGEEYPAAPVGLVIEALLRGLFETGGVPRRHLAEEHELPENLRRFFQGQPAAPPVASSCCPPAERETCCEPDQKGACCDDSEPTTCGCR
jgi:hypothetical protein